MKLVSVETPEKSVCKMTFSATAEELEAASNAVYERTRANYTIKGFEKGEADRAQIEADRGEHTFWYDAINDLMDKDVPALYDAALAEHGFHPVDEPSYDLVSVKKDEGFVATATVALQPELNLTQTTGFVVECVTPAVTDKEIDAVLERRRNAAAELVPHKGPAVKGNVVHMDFEGLLDGVAFQGGTAQNQSVQLGRYSGLVRSCARPLFLAGGDSEDLIQEGMFGLIRAIREYDGAKAASFRTFAEVCIRNRLISALRAASRDKHSPLNQSVPLDTPFFDGNSYPFGALRASSADPEELIIDRDRVAEALESTRKQLSEFEAKILGLYLDGLSCQEIAKEVGKSPKSVDNAVQRVRRKAARQLSSGDISKR